jgi:sterol desaturase/sphingolipid hydroxylase (fatty acid hydroxylase superfamily)
MLAIFASLAVAFFVAERLWPIRTQSVKRSGFLTDVAYVPIQILMRVVVNGTLALGLASLGQRFLPPRLFGILQGRSVWLQALVLIVVLDFVFYVTHRLKHRWSWWWRLHETHHSSVELDFLSSARFHPIEKLLDRVIYLIPLLVLGVSHGAILVWASVDALSGMLIHANVRRRLGPLIYVFMGPELHRWHHARDAAGRQRNFGNTLSVFDWLCGTALLTEAEPREFGVDDPAYPVSGLGLQFLYAFRSEAASQPAPASDHSTGFCVSRPIAVTPASRHASMTSTTEA